MNKHKARRLAASSSIRELQPGDEIISPRGERLYMEPKLIVPGWKALAFVIGDQPVGVIVFRPGEATKLRYCDNEGRIHEETVDGLGIQAQMHAGMARMGELVRLFLGERHPLAEAPSANAQAA